MTAWRGISDRQMMVSWKSHDQAIHPFPTALVQTEDEFCKGSLSFLQLGHRKLNWSSQKSCCFCFTFCALNRIAGAGDFWKLPLWEVLPQQLTNLSSDWLKRPCIFLVKLSLSVRRVTLCSCIMLFTSKQTSPAVKPARNKIQLLFFFFFFLSSWYLLFINTGNKRCQSKGPKPTSCRKDSYQNCREISCIIF